MFKLNLTKLHAKIATKPSANKTAPEGVATTGADEQLERKSLESLGTKSLDVVTETGPDAHAAKDEPHVSKQAIKKTVAVLDGRTIQAASYAVKIPVKTTGAKDNGSNRRKELFALNKANPINNNAAQHSSATRMGTSAISGESKPVATSNTIRIARIQPKPDAASAKNKPFTLRPSNRPKKQAPIKTKRDILFGTGITKAASRAKKTQTATLEAKKAKSKLVYTKAKSNANTDVLQLDRAENEATKIKTLTPNIVGALKEDLLASDITLDESQSKALAGLIKQKFGCLIGAAGTGKTTTVKQLINAIKDTIGTFDIRTARRYKGDMDKPTPEGLLGKDIDEPEYNIPIAFVAFAGKAVQQIKRALPRDLHPMCATIHSTLGYAPEWNEVYDPEAGEYVNKMRFEPHFTAENKLPYKIIVMDEAGTTPIDLFNNLVAALKDDCRIILIGDINQLAPVTGRSVLGFAMLQWPTYALTKIHRQAEGNAIIENAHRVLNGQLPERASNFALKTIHDGSISAVREVLQAVQYLHRNGNFDPLTDALIVPQNVGNLGQVALNEQLVRYFNPPRKDEDGKITNPRHIVQAGFGQGLYAAGDKVMLLANNNDLGLTNGMIGIVQEIVYNGGFKGQNIAQRAAEGLNDKIDIDLSALDLSEVGMQKEVDDEPASQRQASHIMKVLFQNHEELVEFTTAGDYNNVAHAYAITCHKSQGSEYENVVIVCHASQHRMLTREWLYTAITRAKRAVILLSNQRGLITAIKNQAIKGHTLEEKARSFLALQAKGDTLMPKLGKPEELT